MTNQTVEKPHPPFLFRWTVLFIISLAMLGNYYVYDSISVIAKMLKTALNFTDSDIGMMNSIYSIAAVIVLLFSGIFIDKYGTKKTTLIFGITCTVATIVTAISPNITVMLTGRFLLGLGAEPLIIAITVAIAKWFKGKELGLALGINIAIARFGSFAAFRSPSWASSFYSDWHGPLLLAIIISLFCSVGALIYFYVEGKGEKKYYLFEASKTDKFVIADLFKFGKSYWLIVVLCATFYSAVFPFQTFAIKYFQEAHGATLEFAGELIGYLPLVAIFATPLLGLLSDLIGKRALLMTLGSIMIVPVYLMLVSGVSLYIPIAMLGIAFSLIPAVMWPSVAYLVEPQRLGSAYALMSLIQQVGVFIFNKMIGWANDYQGASVANPAGYELGMWIFSVLGIVGLVFAYLLRKAETGPNKHGLEEGMKSTV